MLDQPIPLRSIYREVIDFSLKANADNYIQAGWQPIIAFQLEPAEFTERIRTKKMNRRYRVGWLRGAGEPPHPPVIDEVPPPRIQDFGSSTN